MAISKRDLLAALSELAPEELAVAGLQRVVTETDHPLRPLDSAPGRAKLERGPDADMGLEGERLYQLEVDGPTGDMVIEFHETRYPHTTTVAVHRYRRIVTPVAPRFLLDGYEHVDTTLASDLAGANEPDVWARLADFAGTNS